RECPLVERRAERYVADWTPGTGSVNRSGGPRSSARALAKRAPIDRERECPLVERRAERDVADWTPGTGSVNRSGGPRSSARALAKRALSYVGALAKLAPSQRGRKIAARGTAERSGSG